MLRTFAPDMAPASGLPPNDVRLRFFQASFDPVDSWAIQQVTRDVAAADTHAELVAAGRTLAATIREHGRDGWAQLLDTAVAQRVLPGKTDGDAAVEKAQLVFPMVPPPLPPPTSPRNSRAMQQDRAQEAAMLRELQGIGGWSKDATVRELQAIGSALRVLGDFVHEGRFGRRGTHVR